MPSAISIIFTAISRLWRIPLSQYADQHSDSPRLIKCERVGNSGIARIRVAVHIGDVLLASTIMKPPAIASTVHGAGNRLIGRDYREGRGGHKIPYHFAQSAGPIEKLVSRSPINAVKNLRLCRLHTSHRPAAIRAVSCEPDLQHSETRPYRRRVFSTSRDERVRALLPDMKRPSCHRCSDLSPPQNFSVPIWPCDPGHVRLEFFTSRVFGNSNQRKLSTRRRLQLWLTDAARSTTPKTADFRRSTAAMKIRAAMMR